MRLLKGVLISLFLAAVASAADTDGNGIDDTVEPLLAQRFCPSYVLHSQDQGVSPEPVEIVGVNRRDLWVRVFNVNGQLVGDYRTTDNWSPNLIDYFQAVGHPEYAWSNYSFLGLGAWQYVGVPPGDHAYAAYFLVFHYDWAGAGNDSPTSWYSQYNSTGGTYSNTVYAHLFVTTDGRIAIQYWCYYPFNDFVNNHEGDWEHINVVITSSDPQTSQIAYVDYYFHHKVTQRQYPGNDFLAENGTHPIVFVGGYGQGDCLGTQGSGPGSHGSYPSYLNWADVECQFCVGCLWEYQDAQGKYLNYSTFTIKTIPNPDVIDYNAQPAMSWLKANIPWGHTYVESYGSWLQEYGIIWSDVGNKAPVGPAYNAAWNKTGAVGDDYQWYGGPYLQAYPYTPLKNPTNLTANNCGVIYCGGVFCGLRNFGVRLEWNANGNINEQGYKIYRNGQHVATVGPGVTYYEDQNLIWGLQYTYKVQAYAYSYVSEFTNEVATTPSSGVPNNPSNVTVSYDSPCNWLVQWNDNSTNETGFHVRADWHNADWSQSGFTQHDAWPNTTSKVVPFNIDYAYLNFSVRAYQDATCGGGMFEQWSGWVAASPSTVQNGNCPSGCPYVMVPSGNGYLPVNNILSFTEDTAYFRKENIDFYLLDVEVKPENGFYELRIGELGEQVTLFDFAGLVAIDLPRDKRIHTAPNGTIYGIRQAFKPVSVVDNLGNDVTALLQEEDGQFFETNRSGYLVAKYDRFQPQGMTAGINPIGQAEVAATCCGGGNPPPCKDCDADKLAAGNVTSPDTVQGNILNIEMLMPDGSWSPITKMFPRAYPAFSVFPLNIDATKETVLRYSWEKGYRADRLALFSFEQIPLKITPLSLTSAQHSSQGAVLQQMGTLADGSTVKLGLGEYIDLQFKAPAIDSGLSRELIFVARGREWTKDSAHVSTPGSITDVLPATYSLFQNSPNPFNEVTRIRYALPRDAEVRIDIYNILGQKIKQLDLGLQSAGYKSITWDGRNQSGYIVSSGVYFYRIKAGEFVETKRMTLLK